MSISETPALEYRREIENIIREWRPRLDFQHWTIVVEFTLRKGLAECIAHPEYQQMTLDFNTKQMQKEIGTYRDLEELVLHEMVHGRVWALANLSSALDDEVLAYFEEELTTQITAALIRTKYNEK